MKKHCSIDIKIQAVLKAARAGVLAEEVANEIGIHTFSLYRLLEKGAAPSFLRTCFQAA